MASLLGSGAGVTMLFATSTTFVPKVTGIGGGELAREVYDTTHFLSAAGVDMPLLRWMEKDAGDYGSAADFTVEMLYDIDTIPPLDKASEVITLQCPPKGAQTTGGKLVFTGFLTKYGGSFGMKDTRRGQFVVAVTGPVEFTAGS